MGVDKMIEDRATEVLDDGRVRLALEEQERNRRAFIKRQQELSKRHFVHRKI